LRGVSKDGPSACGHPSRLAEDGERLRMTEKIGESETTMPDFIALDALVGHRGNRAGSHRRHRR
jgi:hypothetical protein